jgi:hypothetical protein
MFSPFLLILAGCVGDTSKEPEDTSGGPDSEADSDTDSDTDTDTDSDTDSDSDSDCTATVSRTMPPDGEADVPIDTTFMAQFSEAVTQADISLRSGGPPVPGQVELAPDGRAATFTPDRALDYDTNYTAEVTVCGQTSNTSFTTAQDGGGVVIDGYTYVVDMVGSDTTWNDPPQSLISLVFQSSTTTLFLFSVQSYQANNLDMIGAIGETENGNQQYPCAAPFDFDPVSAPGGQFATIPIDATLSAGGYNLEMHDFTSTGKLAGDGMEISNVHITGKVDVGPLLADYGYTCAQLVAFGVSCVDCGNGSPSCLNMDFEDASAPYQAGLSIDPSYPDMTDPRCN